MDIGKKLRLAIAGAALAFLAACGGGGGGAGGGATVQYTLTAATAGTGTGSVTSGPAGINCGTSCTASYDDGTSVTLTATPANGSVFNGWSGACTGSATQVAVTVDAARTCTASFAAMRALGVSLMGAGGGTVTGNPAGIACGSTCSASHVDGTSVVLTAAPVAGSAFVQWGGDCAGMATTATVVLTAPRGCTAQFEPVRTLAVTKAGSGGGTVTSNVGGINCGTACTGDLLVGTNVTLTAAAANGSVFAGWGGACSGAATTANVSMNAALTCTANFNAVVGPVNHSLTVTKSGVGSGTVTSAPAGINCGVACSATFAESTVVTLTASAAAGSTFAGWSGACSGTAEAVTVTMGGARDCTAAFNSAGGGALSDAGYHLIAEAGVFVASTSSVTFADSALPNSQFALHAVNVNTGVATVVEAAGQLYPLGTVVEAPGNPVTETIPTIRTRVSLFAKGGRLYRLDHVSAGGPPTLQLWSTVLTRQICFGVLGAFSDFFQSAFNSGHQFYRAPGADGQCGTADDESWAIANAAGANDSPVRVAGTAIDVIRGPDLVVTGYLRWVNGQVVRLDATLSNPVNLFATTRAPQTVTVGVPGAESTWLYQTDVGNLLAYDLQSNRAIAAPNIRAGVLGSFQILGVDRDTLYFRVRSLNPTSTSFVRVNAALNGSVVSTIAGDIGQAYLTPTRIVYVAGNQLLSVPKSGGTPVVIATIAAPQTIAYHQVTGETVWYETREGTTRRIGIVQSDGSGARIIQNALLAGSLSEAPSSYYGPQWGGFTLIEGLGVNGAAAGATLRTYAANGSVVATHGALPSTGQSHGIAVPAEQVGRHGLASYLVNESINLLLFKTDQAGLVQVTAY